MTWLRKLGPALLGLLVVSGVCWRHDLPAFPDPPPKWIAEHLTNSDDRFYEYFLSGYADIDAQFLWRIDASAESIAAIIALLQMEETETVPDAFWRMPPQYWPRRPGEGLRAYRTALFDPDRRGEDGGHYFLVHDVAAGRAFVWVKSNF